MAVAAIHRSASCSFWPSGCPSVSQDARSLAQVDINASSAWTIEKCATLRSSERRRSSLQLAFKAPYRSSVIVANDKTMRRRAMSLKYSAAGSGFRVALRIADTTIVSSTTADFWWLVNGQ